MTISPHSLLTRSLREKPWGYKVSRILAAALAAVDPPELINIISVPYQSNDPLLSIEIPILGRMEDYKRIFLLAIGKAALPMTISLGDKLGDRLSEGYVLVKTEYPALPERFKDRIQVFTGGHPVPNQNGLQATAEILSKLSILTEDDMLVLLLSGGSSALFTQPAEGISLPDLQATNQVLLSCGADIEEINIIRKHLSQTKGGLLAKHLQPAKIFSLILSDVIGDRIDLIGSGPTAPDPSTFSDALDIITYYGLKDELPDTVISHLALGNQGKIPETPKMDDPIFQRTSNIILANNQTALRAGVMQAAIEGFASEPYPDHLEGEARQVGKSLANQLSEMARKNNPLKRPACLIAGGETTVTLRDTTEPGLGGRNLELALSALPVLDGLSNVALITLATDGEDGTTYAAGAVVTGESYQRCQQLGLDPLEYLQRHDSYSILHKLDDLIVTGPTGTNVNDLCFLFTF